MLLSFLRSASFLQMLLFVMIIVMIIVIMLRWFLTPILFLTFFKLHFYLLFCIINLYNIKLHSSQKLSFISTCVFFLACIIDRLKLFTIRKIEKRKNILFLKFFEIRNYLRQKSLTKKVEKIGTDHYLFFQMKFFFDILKLRNEERKNNIMRKEISTKYFKDRMESFILMQIKISQTCICDNS